MFSPKRSPSQQRQQHPAGLGRAGWQLCRLFKQAPPLRLAPPSALAPPPARRKGDKSFGARGLERRRGRCQAL